MAPLSDDQEGLVHAANMFYASKGFEYFDSTLTLMMPPLPAIEPLRELAHLLVERIEPTCVAAIRDAP